MIFTGTFENKVDGKGRVSVPAAFRALIQESKSGELAIFPSFRFQCLEAMSFDMLAALARQTPKANLFSKARTNPFDLLFRATHRFHIDDAGRITLPEALIAKAGISGKAIFTGEGHSFQIWSADAYAIQVSEDEATLADLESLEAFEADFAAAALEIAL